MMTVLLSAPHAPWPAPPHWSPYALGAGIVIGFVLGALAAICYALRLQRIEKASRRSAAAMGTFTIDLPGVTQRYGYSAVIQPKEPWQRR